MAWTATKSAFGVCGNFRFAFYDLTDIKATRSLIKPEGIGAVKFVASTNTTDNTDVLLAKALKWDGTADTDHANGMEDGSETFDPVVNGLRIDDIDDNGLATVYIHTDTDTLLCFDSDGAAVDLFSTNDEVFQLYNERVIQVLAGDADDDGTLFVMGR